MLQTEKTQINVKKGIHIKLQGAALNRYSLCGAFLSGINDPPFAKLWKTNENYEVPKRNHTVINPLISWRMSIVRK